MVECSLFDLTVFKLKRRRRFALPLSQPAPLRRLNCSLRLDLFCKFAIRNSEFLMTILHDPEQVASAAADRFVAAAEEAIGASGRFSTALSGGSTPLRVFQKLAGDDYRNQIDWLKTHIFFGDER